MSEESTAGENATKKDYKKGAESTSGTTESSINSPIKDAPPAPAMEVSVDSNIERAIRVLKRKMIREGTFRELKLRRYNEKPNEKKRRKSKEALKRTRKESSRQRKIANGLM